MRDILIQSAEAFKSARQNPQLAKLINTILRPAGQGEIQDNDSFEQIIIELGWVKVEVRTSHGYTMWFRFPEQLMDSQALEQDAKAWGANYVIENELGCCCRELMQALASLRKVENSLKKTHAVTRENYDQALAVTELMQQLNGSVENIKQTVL